MGFKLNLGTVNAVNKLLRGSGVSIAVEVTAGEAPARTLELSVDPNTTQNSNMGFKLNVVSVPDDGIPMIGPQGDEYVLRKITGASGEYLGLELGK